MQGSFLDRCPHDKLRCIYLCSHPAACHLRRRSREREKEPNAWAALYKSGKIATGNTIDMNRLSSLWRSGALVKLWLFRDMDTAAIIEFIALKQREKAEEDSKE